VTPHPPRGIGVGLPDFWGPIGPIGVRKSDSPRARQLMIFGARWRARTANALAKTAASPCGPQPSGDGSGDVPRASWPCPCTGKMPVVRVRGRAIARRAPRPAVGRPCGPEPSGNGSLFPRHSLASFIGRYCEPPELFRSGTESGNFAPYRAVRGFAAALQSAYGAGDPLPAGALATRWLGSAVEPCR
jgi:hypothetical protein